jgi:hypothetical protein
MNEIEIINHQEIQKRIYILRNKHVILDKDLAEFYQVKPIRLREQVKRNPKRFPPDFMFQINEAEVNYLLSQNAIPSKSSLGGYLPFVFTEQGVAAISAVLTSDRAIEVNIQIMRAFVAMRHFLISNAQLFHEINSIKLKQADTDQKVDLMFEAFESKLMQPSQGIFFDGQTFDAWNFASDLVRKAQKSLILIDNFIDDSVLMLFSKRAKNVKVTIYTKSTNKQLDADLKKFNNQYEPVVIKQFSKSHDRFLIIDEKEVYLIGASLKDLGKKWFGFSRIDSFLNIILDNLKKF